MKFQRKLAELTEAVKIKGLGTMGERLSGKFDELTEAGKQLETMIQPLFKDQIMKLVVKLVQEITSSEVVCVLYSFQVTFFFILFFFSGGFAECQVYVLLRLWLSLHAA